MIDTIYLVEIVIGGISILSSFFNMLMFIFYRSVRTEASELIFCLSIACIMTNISYIMHFTKNEENTKGFICQTQGFLMMWFELSQAVWATLISHSVYNNIINDDNELTGAKRVKYVLIGFIIPLMASISLLMTKQLGYAKYWCWIDTTTNIYLRKIIYSAIFGFLWLLFFFSFYFIYKVIRFLEKHYTKNDEKEVIYKYIKRIRLFPIIQVSCMIPGTLSRFLQIFGITHIFFDYLNVIFISMQGLLYSLVFGFNPIIKTQVKELFQRCCNCCYEDGEDPKQSVLSTEMAQK